MNICVVVTNFGQGHSESRADRLKRQILKGYYKARSRIWLFFFLVEREMKLCCPEADLHIHTESENLYGAHFLWIFFSDKAWHEEAQMEARPGTLEEV